MKIKGIWKGAGTEMPTCQRRVRPWVLEGHVEKRLDQKPISITPTSTTLPSPKARNPSSQAQTPGDRLGGSSQTTDSPGEGRWVLFHFVLQQVVRCKESSMDLYGVVPKSWVQVLLLLESRWSLPAPLRPPSPAVCFHCSLNTYFHS